MNRAFISYSRKNQSFAERLARDLGDAGLDVWIDLREIQAGEFWQQEIYRGLERAEFMIACLSPEALASQWVRREINVAREKGKLIYPVLITDMLELLHQDEELQWLADVQFINFEGRYEQAFPELLEALPGGRPLGSFDPFDPASIPNPFKGLEAFQQTDAALFFGREELTRRALQRLRRTAFLAIVGASGSGKSSLVRAGIIPQIRAGALDGSESWPILIFTPGAHPIEALARRLRPLLHHEDDGAGRSLEALMDELRTSGKVLPVVQELLQDSDESTRLVLVVDQFEEVFTRTSETPRAQFLDTIRILATIANSRAQIIITMRADFFGQLSHYPDLANLFEQDNLLIVTEMTTANLLRAIEGPAQAVGLRYEQGLVDRILDDVKTEPGSLPLLQYALHELFKRREGAKLTIAAYEEIGGVRQALAQHAESVFQQLNPAQQDIMRQMLLRLVEVSESGEATRRRVPRNELNLREVPDKDVQAVIDLLTAAETRLLIANREITSSQDAPVVMLQVSHEALIREWERFQTWVHASLDDLRYEAELRKAADNWQSNAHDEAYLLRGKRLNRAELWLEDNPVTEQQREFIEASIAAEQERERREAERLQRELELQHRATRRARLAIGVLAVLFLGAAVAGVTLALFANELQNTQSELQDQRAEALDNAAEARSLAVAANAQQAFNSEDVDLGLALGVAAVDTEDPPTAAQRIFADIALAPGTRDRIAVGGVPSALAVAPQGALAAAGTQDGALTLYDAQTAQVLHELEGHPGAITAVLFSADGALLMSAAEGASANLRVWDVASGTLLHELAGHSASVNALTLLEGGVLLSGGEDMALRLRNPQTGAALGTDYAESVALDNPHEAPITALASAPEQSLVASGDAQSRLVLHDLTNGVRWNVRFDTRSFAPAVSALAFNAAGDKLLVGLSDGRLLIVETATGATDQEFTALDEGIVNVAYLPGQQRFVASGADRTLRLWDVRAGQQIQAFDLDGAIRSLAVSPDGHLVLTGVDNGTLRFWDLEGGAELARYENVSRVSNIAISPDGQLAAAGSIGGVVQLWDVPTEARLDDLTLNNNRTVTAIAFHPDGTALAVGDLNGTITLLNLQTGESVQRFVGHGLRVDVLLFSTDGSRLLSGSSDQQVILWDVETGAEIRRYTGHDGRIRSLAFSSDGTRILSGDTDGVLILWDLSTGAGTRRFDGHEGGIISADLSPDGTQVLSGGQDGTIRLWDVASGRETRRFEGHDGGVTSALFLPGGAVIVSSGQDGTIRLWDVASGEEVRRYEVENASGRAIPIESQVLNADGTLALSGLRDNTIRLWALLPGNERLVQWARENRFIRALDCDEQLRFGVQVGLETPFELFGEQRFVDVDSAEFLPLRAEADPASEVIASLEAGTSVRLLAQEALGRDVQFRVCTTDGVEGWLPAAGLSALGE